MSRELNTAVLLERGGARRLTAGGTGVQRIAPAIRTLILELDLEAAVSTLRLRGTFPTGVAGGWKIRWTAEPLEDLGLVRISVYGHAPLAAERFAWSKQPFDLHMRLPRVTNPQVPYDLLLSTLKGQVLARIPWTPLA